MTEMSNQFWKSIMSNIMNTEQVHNDLQTLCKVD